MKRHFTKVVNNLIGFVYGMSIAERIGFAISVVVGIYFGISIWVCADKVPATATDYEQLENQMYAIEQNPDILFNTDCAIDINDDIITVEYRNANCRLKVEYDKNFEILSTSEYDKSVGWLEALLCSICIGVAFFVLINGIVITIEDMYLNE